MCQKVVLLALQVSVSVVVHVRGQSEDAPSNESDGNTNDDGGSSDSTASIIGFSVVLSLLLLAVCVVTLLCFRYGSCKCILKRQSHGHAHSNVRSHSFIPGLRQQPSEQQLQPQGTTTNQLQGVTNPSFGAAHIGGNFEHPPLTPTNSHSVVMFPSAPRYVAQGTPPPQMHEQSATQGVQRLPSLQMKSGLSTDQRPPYPGFGYPYQPCKSPRVKLHYDAQSIKPLPVCVSDLTISASSRRADISGDEREREVGGGGGEGSAAEGRERGRGSKDKEVDSPPSGYGTEV